MKVIAHRGNSAHYPENTPAGWDSAFAHRAHAIEADIRFSADGVGICAHDPTLQRLFKRDERTAALSYAELASLAGAQGATISLYTDVLAYAREGQSVVLDLKEESPAALEGIWQAIDQRVPHDRRPLIVVGCHSLAAVEFFAARGGVTILGFIPAHDTAADFLHAGATIIRLWERDVTPLLVEQLQALGAQVWVTTGGEPTGRRVGDTDQQSLAALHRAGVEGVLVNDVPLVNTLLEALQ